MPLATIDGNSSIYTGVSTSSAALMDLPTENTCLPQFKPRTYPQEMVYTTDVTFNCHKDACLMGTEFVVKVEANYSASIDSLEVRVQAKHTFSHIKCPQP